MVTFCEITTTKKKEKTFEYNNIQETPMERAIRLVPFQCNDCVSFPSQRWTPLVLYRDQLWHVFKIAYLF